MHTTIRTTPIAIPAFAPRESLSEEAEGTEVTALLVAVVEVELAIVEPESVVTGSKSTR
jgi:hypothetical protein